MESDKMGGRIAEFLNRMSNVTVDSLPLVHTTPAYNLRRIFEDKTLKASPCDFFGGEKLCYFFFGRPAYKWQTEGEACDWELPVCFIFEYDISGASRIYPFDTGAFLGKKLPTYLGIMPLEEFEIGSVTNSPSKLVAAYFHSVTDYYSLKTKPEQEFRESFDVDDIESEVRALHKLYSQPRERADDRRATVEVQFSEDISLEGKKPIGLILPDIYLKNESIVKYTRERNISLIPYDTFPLNASAYTSIIYSKLRDLYRKKKYIRR